MNTSFKFFLFSCLALVFVFSSCKEDEPGAVDFLTGTTWVVSEVVKDGVTDTTDYSSYRVTYSKTGSLSGIDEDGDAFSGTWQFQNGESVLRLIDSADPSLFLDLTIGTLNNATFSYTVVPFGIETQNWTLIAE